MIMDENKVYDLDYEINALNAKHDVSKKKVMEYAHERGMSDNKVAEFIHFANEFDLLSVPIEVLEKVSEMAKRAIKYDQEHRRGRKPTTTVGIIRSRIKREVAIRGLTGSEIETALEKPGCWYERISTGKQVIGIFDVKGIAACLGVTMDSLFPKSEQPTTTA